MSVLAGLLISVGIAIIDFKGFRQLRHVPKADATVMLLVLVWTVLGNLIHAVTAGVVLASILFMKKASDLAEQTSKVEPMKPEPHWGDESSDWDQTVYIKHVEGPLFFGFSSGFRVLSEGLPEGITALVVRMERVPYIDQSGLCTLEDTILTLTQKGTRVALTGLQAQPDVMLRRIRIIPDLVGEDRVFETFADCERWLEADRSAQQLAPS